MNLGELDVAVTECAACPRLVEWREHIGEVKRRSFAADTYWARPVAGFGSTTPRILVVGLAPAAHGANRTGRMFTGDRSGDWLYASLHRTGLANQAASVDKNDGLQLIDTRITAAVRCAPPENKPSPQERDNCSVWLDAEFALVREHVRVVVALGSFAFTSVLGMLKRAGHTLPSPRPKFTHGVQVRVGLLTVIGSYHPSQQNTFTGKLTADMLDAVFAAAIRTSQAE